MSKTEQMNALYEKVSADLDLQKKLMCIMQETKEVGTEQTRERLIQFAHDAGFDVDFTEMQQFFKDTIEKKEGQLSDTELDMVAGGFNGSVFWGGFFAPLRLLKDIVIALDEKLPS